MTTLYQAIRVRNTDGLPYEEAVQLFLWTFCTLDFLPAPLKNEPISKEELIEVFERLTVDGLILLPKPDEPEVPRKPLPIEWANLVKAFLLKEVRLDDSFLDRAHRYI